MTDIILRGCEGLPCGLCGNLVPANVDANGKRKPGAPRVWCSEECSELNRVLERARVLVLNVRRKATADKSEELERRLWTRYCVVEGCGEQFLATRHNHVFCSSGCRRDLAEGKATRRSA